MAFENALWEYEIPLNVDDVIAAHFIHSCLNIRERQNKLTHTPGMTADELITANLEDLQNIIKRFKKERGYQIGPESVTMAAKWYIGKVPVKKLRK